MRNKEIKIKYEPEADVLSWELSKQPIDYASDAGNLVIHFSKNNQPVLVEILEAGKFLINAQRIKRTAQVGELLTVR